MLRATEPSLSYHFPRTGIKGRTGVEEARATCLTIDNHYPLGYVHGDLQDSGEQVWNEPSDSGDCVKQPRHGFW